MDGSPRILIVRLSAIGDVIHGLPVLCALRKAFPEAYLGWVVEGRAGELLDTEVVLYVVKPNELKNSLHGEDARLVRDELCGGIRARQQQLLLVVDVVDVLLLVVLRPR